MKVNHSLKRLFVSRTRIKLLQIFYKSPLEYFYVRQLVRLAGEEINSVRRELSNLKAATLINSEARSNRLYYYTNPENPLYLELLTIVRQSTGLGQKISEDKSIGQVKALLFSQHFLYGADYSPDHIDMVVVGDINLRQIDTLVKSEEKDLGREINYMVMDRPEFRLRKQKRDPVLVDFFLNCPIVIIGQPNLLSDHF